MLEGPAGATGSSDRSPVRRTGKLPLDIGRSGIDDFDKTGLVAVPEVRYAKTPDGAHLAFVVLGAGAIDLVEVGNGTNMSIEAAYDEPRWEGYLAELASFARVIRFDPRGIGLSDPLGAPRVTIEQYANDTLVVMKAAACSDAALLATGHSGPVAVYLAATQPSLVRALVLINSYARVVRSDDYPHGIPVDLYNLFVESLVDPAPAEAAEAADDLPLMAPSRLGDTSFQSWWRQAGHRGASPATALAMFTLARDSDVRELLPEIRAPTLVVHARGNKFVRAELGRYLADHTTTATYDEIASADHLPWTDDTDLVGDIEEFLIGTRRASLANRRLATVLFTDIVGSTEAARILGDQAWRDRLDRHDLLTERQLSRFGGRLVKTTGDGVLATFDGPAAAIRCAQAIADAVSQIGVAIRCGIHIGEIEQRDDDIAGIAVHIGQRICSAAQPGEILVSRTVTDLVAGSSIEFEDRGEHDLKGVSGSWRLFAVRG